MGERLGLVDQLHFADQHFGVGRHFDACHLGDFRCGLPHDGRVQTAVFQDDVLNRFQFFTLQQIAAVGSEAFAYRIINRVDDDNRLFGSADNAAVEGFGHQDRGDHALDVCGFVYHDRGITGTDADGRLAGAVGCLHHARATGGQDQVDVRVVHQLVGQLDGRLVDPTDDVFGAPAAIAACSTISAALLVAFFARGCGEKMMPLRVFRLISALKIAVEVGLVVGTIPQIKPIGSAMVMVPKVSSSDRMPQVFRLYRRCRCTRKRSGF